MNYYQSNQIKEFLNNFDVKKLDIKSKKKVEYYNIPCAFDIETTSCYKDLETDELIKANDYAEMEEYAKRNHIKSFNKQRYLPLSWMYIWMLNINSIIIIGRTWEEFEHVMYSIRDYFKLGEQRRLMIFIHNQSFEFQFLKSIFKFSKVFSIDAHQPIYSITDQGFEFRCSYILSNMSLATIGKNLIKYKAEKMSGDLDYTLIRTSDTVLTEKEMGYCINDVVVLHNYIKECMEEEEGNSLLKIPLTSTGYVRRYCREYCLKNNPNHYEYRKLMWKMSLDLFTYNKLKQCFQGGFTHANALNTGVPFNNVKSMDFTSSYPAVLLLKKFPMGKGVTCEIKSSKHFWYLVSNKACFMTIEFYDLKLKHNIYEAPISKNKCEELEKYELDNLDFRTIGEDNGRIVSAKRLITTITNVDFKLYCKCYNWSGFRIHWFRYYEWGYLPKELKEAILYFYVAKTQLKGVIGKESEYQRAKGMLNSTYGMMVTDIVKALIAYDSYYDEWSVDDSVDAQSSLEKYNKSRNRFLSYEWGIFCTSWARSENLFSGVLELKDDFIYCDTDSVKFVNYEKHKKYFESYNENIFKEIETVCKEQDLDINMFSPVTKKGVKKPIGVWDDDGDYEVFATLGSKRYLVKYIEPSNDIKDTYHILKDKEKAKEEFTDAEKTEFKNIDKQYGEYFEHENTNGYLLTVSGVNKKIATPYMCEVAKEKNIKVEELFNENLYFPCGKSGKKLHKYIDTPMDEMIKDYQGHTTHVIGKSGLLLQESSYSMSMADIYKDYIEGIQYYYAQN